MVKSKRKAPSDLQHSNKRLHTGAGAVDAASSISSNNEHQTTSPWHDQPPHPAHQAPNNAGSPSNSGILKILPRPAQLPPLPPVRQAALREQAFTHPGAVHGADSRRVARSYDRLEFLGDAYLELVASRFLFDALPQLGAGRLSQVREQLVSNRTLAEYACAYGFDARARLAAGLQEQQQQQRLQQQQRQQQQEHGRSGGGDGGGSGAQVKMYADIFEAYVAAIVLDDPVTGFATAEAWLQSLWRPRVPGARQPAGFGGGGGGFGGGSGGACAAVITGHTGGSGGGSGSDAAGHADDGGGGGGEDPGKGEPEPKQQLAVKVMSPGCRLEYQLQPRTLARGESPQDLEHTVHVYFTGYGKWARQRLGSGAGPNKAVAGSRAALQALEHCPLLGEIAACKAAYVAASSAAKAANANASADGSSSSSSSSSSKPQQIKDEK